MARKEFAKSVKVARLRHATREGVIYCEGCGVMIKPGMFAFDHDNPDGMTGEPTFDNCRVLCTAGEESCHGKKTKVDQGNIARAKRIEAKDAGISVAPSRPLQSPGFRPTQKSLDRKSSPKLPMPPRRSMFTRI